jgi:hypothetical protein
VIRSDATTDPTGHNGLRRAAASLVFLAVVTVGGLVGEAGGRLGRGERRHEGVRRPPRHGAAWYADDAPVEAGLCVVHGMLATLDPHTNFLEPTIRPDAGKTARVVLRARIIISKRNGKITVITPLEAPRRPPRHPRGDIIDRVEGSRSTTCPWTPSSRS